MVTSDMLLRLITELQRDVTARKGRRTLLKFICASSAARLALLFEYDKVQQVLILLDRWGRRSPSFPGVQAPQSNRSIPDSGLFGAALGQRGPLYTLNALADNRSLPQERYWMGRYDQLVIGGIGEGQGVLVLCFERGYIPAAGADPRSVPDENNLRFSLALLSAYLSEEKALLPGSNGTPAAGEQRLPVEALQWQRPGLEQPAQVYEQRLQAAIDEERERIAQNIHDTVAQQLADVLYKLEFISRILDRESEAARREIVRVSDILKESLHEIRYNISALVPLQLEEQGFENALRSLLEEYRRNEPEVKLDYEGEALALMPPSLEVPVFRFIQEALHNVQKHASASRISVRIRVTAGLLLIEISDNGQGFDMTEVMNRQAVGTGYHIGLRNMRNRIHQAGGSWEIQSKRGAGTSVKARFRLATHPSALTYREREVLRLVAEGLTNRAIAARLSVSTETVKSHVHHIMQKMHVNDRTQAAVIAARQQWL